MWGWVSGGKLGHSGCFHLVVEDAHGVQSVEVLLQQGGSSRVKIDLIQLQHRYCHPEQGFVHGGLLETHAS